MAPTLIPELDSSANIFRDRYAHLSAQQWCEVIVRSIESPMIDGLEFPRFPDQQVQEQIHGNHGAPAVRDAGQIYAFLSSRPFYRQKAVANAAFLDFGTGWGRITRMFLRDFDLSGLYGYEPQRATCCLARLLNPYVCFVNGSYRPDDTLPPNRFDFVVGWSVFSHLPEEMVIAWLAEMGRIVRPDGYCAFSTYGGRFIDALIAADADVRAGKPTHWYYEYCMQVCDNLRDLPMRYRNGDFIYFGDGPLPHYGRATVMHAKTLTRLLRTHKLPFELVEFDDHTLSQDIFILHRR